MNSGLRTMFRNNPKKSLNDKANPRHRGYTLIELLVVFSVVAILSGIGIASLISYGRGQQINQSASDIKLLISQARFNSLSAVKTVRNLQGMQVSCGTSPLAGYAITVVGGDTLSLSQECITESPNDIQRLLMAENISFATSTTCNRIFFDSLTTRASGVPCNIVIEGYGQTKTIAVDAIGNVSIN